MAHNQNGIRRRIEAEENAVLDVQFAILDLLRENGVTKEQLAKRLGVSKARVSQLFGAGANPTVKQLARIFDALDRKLEWRSCDVSAGQSLLNGSWPDLDIGRFQESLRNVRGLPADQRPRPANDSWPWLDSIAA
jgi:transcriptional regulator with XRE-family HTH domain